jgi:hypothetical protein
MVLMVITTKISGAQHSLKYNPKLLRIFTLSQYHIEILKRGRGSNPPDTSKVAECAWHNYSVSSRYYLVSLILTPLALMYFGRPWENILVLMKYLIS